MSDLEIISPGLFTTVQDSGRYGYQSYGIPVSGAMDMYAYKMANYILGNSESDAVLEATISGPRILFRSTMEIALTGGDMSPSLNGDMVEMWRSIEVKPGDVLSFGELKSGARTYIAFSGGLDIPLTMGSRSTYARGEIGGYLGRQLHEGDKLKVFRKAGLDGGSFSKRLNPLYVPEYSKEKQVRVVLGPQKEYFSDRGIETFLCSEYRCTAQIDRMGYRLTGPKVESISGTDIVSDGIAFGAIQVTNGGDPIIMMSDRQTVGGYAKIACVVYDDLSKIAQSKSGDRIRFKSVAIEEVQRARL